MSLALLAGATVGLSLLWVPGTDRLVEDMSRGELFGSAQWEPALSVATIVLALGVAWQLARQGRLGSLCLPPRLQAAAGDWLGLPAGARLLVVSPVIALSRVLARFDDRVIDAGVRAVGKLAQFVSRLFSIRVEWTFDGFIGAVGQGAVALAGLFSTRAEKGFDGVVRSVAVTTMGAASSSRVVDEVAIDGAVEGGARAVGNAGSQSQRLQTGLAHQYYIVVVAGLAAAVAVLVLSGWAAQS